MDRKWYASLHHLDQPKQKQKHFTFNHEETNHGSRNVKPDALSRQFSKSEKLKTTESIVTNP